MWARVLSTARMPYSSSFVGRIDPHARAVCIVSRTPESGLIQLSERQANSERGFQNSGGLRLQPGTVVGLLSLELIYTPFVPENSTMFQQVLIMKFRLS